MKTFKIEIPKGFEIDKDKSTFENIVFKEVLDKFQKVFEYHSTTKEQFDLDYSKVSAHAKAYEKECMLVAFYNKGWIPDFKNKAEYKYHPYFYMEEFRLSFVDCCVSFCVPARLLWKNEKDVREATEEYLDIFKDNRK